MEFLLLGVCLMGTQETGLHPTCASYPQPGSWEGTHQPGPVHWVWDSDLSEGWAECRTLRDKRTDTEAELEQSVLAWLDLENGSSQGEEDVGRQGRRELMFKK